MAGKPDQSDVVKRGDDLISDDGVDRQPGFGGEFVTVDRGQRHGQIGHVHFGEEAELAEVHPKDRRALPVR